MKRIRPPFIVALAGICVLLSPKQASAEEEVWLRTRLSGEVVENLELTYDQQFKWMERPEQLDRWQHTFAMDYTLKPWLELGAGYRLTSKPSDRDEEDVCCIHRPFVQTKLKTKWKKIRFSFRLRAQSKHKSGDPVETMTRARLKVAWKALKWLRFHVSEETFWSPGSSDYDSQRFDLGAKVRVIKGIQVGAFARREFVYDDSDTTIYGANVAYTW